MTISSNAKAKQCKIRNLACQDAEHRTLNATDSYNVYDPNVGKMYPERTKDVLPYAVRMAIKQNDNMVY